MIDGKTMTLEQAWAEVDRLDKESDVACAAAKTARLAWRAAEIASVRSLEAWDRAMVIASSIGNRHAKDPS